MVNRSNAVTYIVFLILLSITLTGSVAGDVVMSTDNSYGMAMEARQEAVKPPVTRIANKTGISHVVVKFRDDCQVRRRGDKLLSLTGRSVTEASQVLRPYISRDLRRLFANHSEKRLDQDKANLQIRSRHELADMNSYYRINVSGSAEAEQVINALNNLDCIEIAYIQPPIEPASDPDPPTPDYVAFQDYREAAPDGVDADYANTFPGGDGTGVKVIDIEGNWRMTHEDLSKAVGGLIAGQLIDDIIWLNHGTASIGVLIADDNGYGVTGICPGADIGMVSVGSMSAAEAIYTAASELEPGDVILVELHAPGPHYNFEPRPDQAGYICVEYWQANYDAIKYAWAKGITVVEAAGNGSEDFDDENMYGPLFDTTYRNSHAILVGAGYPPVNEHNLERHGFSNYGERVNVQAYGGNVYATGYGDLFNGGGDPDQYYTQVYSGTSSASAIIAGTVACLQGYYQIQFGSSPSSDGIRDALVTTGTPQQGDTSRHIGPRPNLQAAMSVLTTPPSLYANPFVIDTTTVEGGTVLVDVYLVNRSATEAFDFTITDTDSLFRSTADDWLRASPQSGTVPAADSMTIEVTLDAANFIEGFEYYKGVLEISWGPSGGSLDSMLLVPAYLMIPCVDSTYVAVSSFEPDGPTYDWISAKDSGYCMPLADYYNDAGDPLDDGTTGSRPLGFGFTFYDQEYFRAYLGVNGAIAFGEPDLNINGYYAELDIPGNPFETFITPLWSDLVIDTLLEPDAGIYVFFRPDTAVIEWYRLTNHEMYGDTELDFEIILTRDRNITFQYRLLGSSGLEETSLIGLSELGCNASSYFDNGDIPQHQVQAGEAIRFVNTTGVWMQSGDIDASGVLDISDLTYLVSYMFDGGPAPIPIESGDVDCSNIQDISDLTYLVEYFFGGGGPPCYFWNSN